MIKSLTSIGNSKAVIIPAQMIKKYNLEKVLLEETENGILIRPAGSDTDFHEAVEKLRQNKDELYSRMKSQASDASAIQYYANAANNLSDIDLDIFE